MSLHLQECQDEVSDSLLMAAEKCHLEADIRAVPPVMLKQSDILIINRLRREIEKSSTPTNDEHAHGGKVHSYMRLDLLQSFFKEQVGNVRAMLEFGS